MNDHEGSHLPERRDSKQGASKYIKQKLAKPKGKQDQFTGMTEDFSTFLLGPNNVSRTESQLDYGRPGEHN